MNFTLLRASIIAALGGLLFGFDTAVISGATALLSEVFELSSSLLGLTRRLGPDRKRSWER